MAPCCTAGRTPPTALCRLAVTVTCPHGHGRRPRAARHACAQLHAAALSPAVGAPCAPVTAVPCPCPPPTPPHPPPTPRRRTSEPCDLLLQPLNLHQELRLADHLCLERICLRHGRQRFGVCAGPRGWRCRRRPGPAHGRGRRQHRNKLLVMLPVRRSPAAIGLAVAVEAQPRAGGAARPAAAARSQARTSTWVRVHAHVGGAPACLQRCAAALSAGGAAALPALANPIGRSHSRCVGGCAQRRPRRGQRLATSNNQESFSRLWPLTSASCGAWRESREQGRPGWRGAGMSRLVQHPDAAAGWAGQASFPAVAGRPTACFLGGGGQEPRGERGVGCWVLVPCEVCGSSTRAGTLNAACNAGQLQVWGGPSRAGAGCC